MTELEAFAQGVEAGREGKSFDDNPHTDDELHFQWLWGFMYGKQLHVP